MIDPERSVSEPDDSVGLLPEHSILSLAEYLAMQRAIGNETRFLLLDRLTEEGPQSATELRDGLDISSNTLHYHLDTLYRRTERLIQSPTIVPGDSVSKPLSDGIVDVGLVENRKRKERGQNGLYSYYRATSLGKGILDHGVHELMREEWELLDAYGE